MDLRDSDIYRLSEMSHGIFSYEDSDELLMPEACIKCIIRSVCNTNANDGSLCDKAEKSLRILIPKGVIV